MGLLLQSVCRLKFLKVRFIHTLRTPFPESQNKTQTQTKTTPPSFSHDLLLLKWIRNKSNGKLTSLPKLMSFKKDFALPLLKSNFNR